MYHILPELYYTHEHEWLLLQNGKARVGITDYAQKSLGDVVYLDFTARGRRVNQKEVVASIESVKAVSEIFAPLAGTITQVNENINRKPELVNQDPYGQGWLFEMEELDLSGLGELLDAKKYEEFLKNLS
ncbi:MAG: glycine cleavage system protein GcvH [Leptospiraceae bacterium]|nr:glycine cleavage system protein GcvH [Leptospiraceae bacterium]MDW8307109.1 glycine cleavage system protein GcvH [Leptospiraceae bacterium]